MICQEKSKKLKINGMFVTVFRKLNGAFCFALLLTFLQSQTARAAISGEEIFKTMCASCHTLSDEVAMGPGLKGINDRRDKEWVIKWVHDPQGVVNSGDEYAVKLFEKFKKVPMPGFPQLTDEEIAGLLDYVKSQEAAVAKTADAGGGAPATKSDSMSPTTSWSDTWPIHTEMIRWLVLGLVVIGFFLYRFKKRTFKLVNEAGYHTDPHHVPFFSLYFLISVVVAAAISYVLVALLQNNVGMVDTFLFMVLPYFALGLFVIGSIYRYTKRGYQVSSLSSQFLEGKKLFWGSQPFHWGMLILFLGHLTAFLFPRAILAWNGEPVRLLILEFSSFAFGLSALLGLILLIWRRLTTKTLLVVANKMDMVVYTVLLTQVISGLGVAFFVRWGSSWFSSVLTPYLRSIFAFDPDINAVSEMPWPIQLHIVSAFVIIGIIPFTRFMHFLVAPIDYIWRRYQLVIWNWNPKNIRSSTKWNFGKKPKNH